MSSGQSLGLCLLLAGLVASPTVAAESPERYRTGVFTTVLASARDSSLTATWVSKIARDQAAFFPKLQVLSSSEYADSTSERILSDQLRVCDGHLRCIRARLEQSLLHWAIVFTVKRHNKAVLVTATIYDLRGSIGTRTLSFETTAATVEQDLRLELTRGLQAQGLVLGAKIWVLPVPPNALVFVEKADSDPSGRFVLPPGTHAAQVSHEGYEDREIELQVRPGTSSEQRVRLDPETRWWASPWVWVAVGAAVATGVTATVIATQPQSVIRPVYGDSP